MTTMETVASYFRHPALRCKPIYAAICIKPNNGHSTGDILTWSCGKRAARDAIAKQWEPDTFRLLRITAADIA